MTWHDRTIRAHGLNFHLTEWGSPTAPPVLCLHGITQTAHSWDEIAVDLSRDHRVLCLDQRGHGDSDWAPDGDYRRQTQVADIAAITEVLGLQHFLLCGMSMGGIVSINFAAQYPEAVRALVIVDVSPEIQAKGVENIRNFIQQQDVLPSFDAFVERAHQFNPRRSIENIRSRLRYNLKQLPDGQWTWKYDPALRLADRGFQGSATTNLWDEVRAIRCPTLLIKGEESDILSADSAEKMQRAIPGSRLAIIPGAGHSVMGDNPAGFLVALRGFLGDLAKSNR